MGIPQVTALKMTRGLVNNSTANAGTGGASLPADSIEKPVTIDESVDPSGNMIIIPNLGSPFIRLQPFAEGANMNSFTLNLFLISRIAAQVPVEGESELWVGHSIAEVGVALGNRVGIAGSVVPAANRFPSQITATNYHSDRVFVDGPAQVAGSAYTVGLWVKIGSAELLGIAGDIGNATSWNCAYGADFGDS